MNEIVKAWLDSLTVSHRLTPSERLEVFRIAQNMSAKEAADELGLAEETVRSKRKQILKKLEIDNTKTLLFHILEFACHQSSTVS